MLYAIKTPKGELLGESIADTKIGAIFNLDMSDEMTDELESIVWKNGRITDDAIRKRVYRAGYKIVPIKITEIKNR